MKKIIAISLLVSLILACKLNNPATNLLVPANLESLIIQVNPLTDTLIVTPKGGKIKILKGTFDRETQIEIKEAYTINDMLLAGLKTESDSTLLQSGGMIYINALNGESLNLKKSIGITIPTAYVEDKMRLFRGRNDIGGLSWNNSTALDTTPQVGNILSGGRLFSKCAPCHQLFKDATGPSLVGVERRGPWSDKSKLLEFMHNVSGFMATDNYAQDLKVKFGSVMSSFPDLTMRDLDNLLAFLQNEEKKAIATGAFLEYISPQVNINDTLKSLSGTNNPIVDSFETYNFSADSFTDFIQSDDTYEFQIETLGWYNIDVDMRGQRGTIDCKLEVLLDEYESAAMSVYLIVPGRKNLSVGVMEGDGHFMFNKHNGSIPLPLNDRAFVLAFGNQGDKFYYGITGFAIKREQKIEVRIKPASREQFLQAIKNEKLEGLNVKVEPQ